MKAIILKNNGGIENLIIGDLPKPDIKPDEVLLRVKAISVNPVDAFVRSNEGALKNILQPKSGEPIVIGWDVSGEVVESGENVKTFKPGDEVFGMVNFPGHGKTYAEFLAAPANHLALKPKNVSHEEAAAATLAALTAWQALVGHAKVEKGDKVLIHAAAGGVGHYAVQIAKHFGATVIGTASGKNKDFVLGLGADFFIDYSLEAFEDKVRDADVVLDSLPGDHLGRSLKAVKRGGRIISIKAQFEGPYDEVVKEKQLYAHRLLVESDKDDIASIANLLEKGSITSHISQTYQFEDMGLAHKQIETGKTRGKIVVLV